MRVRVISTKGIFFIVEVFALLMRKPLLLNTNNSLFALDAQFSQITLHFYLLIYSTKSFYRRLLRYSALISLIYRMYHSVGSLLEPPSYQSKYSVPSIIQVDSI